MSLNIYLRNEDVINNREIIEDNDIVFNYDLYNGMTMSSDVKMVMKSIDGAEYLCGTDIRTRYGNITSMENLSTGCKTVINILNHCNSIISCIECGDNVLNKIIKMKKGNILLYYLPSLSENSVIDVKVHTSLGVVDFNSLDSFSDFCESYMEA